MANTKTVPVTVEDVMNEGNLNRLPSAMRTTRFGGTLTYRKVTFAGLPAAKVHNITDAAHFAAATVVPAFATQGPSVPGGRLPAIGEVATLRVTGGGAAGPLGVTDAGGAAVAATATYPGTALLSDDGTTLTFADLVTDFVLTYRPRPVGTSGTWPQVSGT